jgi:hypothetical protein
MIACYLLPADTDNRDLALPIGQIDAYERLMTTNYSCKLLEEWWVNFSPKLYSTVRYNNVCTVTAISASFLLLSGKDTVHRIILTPIFRDIEFIEIFELAIGVPL